MARHRAVVQKVVDAIVVTMRWIATHTAAQIADKMPPAFVNNGLVTRAAYTAELGTDKGQFLPNGMMPPALPPWPSTSSPATLPTGEPGSHLHQAPS